MFPHTITIYRHSVSSGEDVYTKQILSGFYWSEKIMLESNSKGNTKFGEVTVISNSLMAGTYTDKWDVQIGDYIVKGKGDDISSIKELDCVYKVSGVAVNTAGSTVDNIVISCA